MMDLSALPLVSETIEPAFDVDVRHALTDEVFPQQWNVLHAPDYHSKFEP